MATLCWLLLIDLLVLIVVQSLLLPHCIFSLCIYVTYVKLIYSYGPLLELVRDASCTSPCGS